MIQRVITRSYHPGPYASGLLSAAIMYRVHDVAELAGRLIDAFLASRMLSGIAASVPPLAAAVVLLRHSGAYGLVSSVGSLVVIGGFFYGAIRRGTFAAGRAHYGGSP